MRRIVLPQAARVIVPPLGNEFNNMLKNTSLRLHHRRLRDVRATPRSTTRRRSSRSSTSLAVAFWYLVLTTVWSVIQAQIERKLAASERGDELSFRERVVAGVDAGAGAGVRADADDADGPSCAPRTCTSASAGSRC